VIELYSAIPMHWPAFLVSGAIGLIALYIDDRRAA